MFGIIYAISALITGAYKSIYDGLEAEDTKRRTYDDNTGIYVGKRGGYRHDKTGKFVSRRGDTWVDIHGDIVVDEREIKREEAKRKGDPNVTVIRYKCDDDPGQRKGLDNLKKAEGRRYQDIETGRLYVIRDFSKKYDMAWDSRYQRSKRLHKRVTYNEWEQRLIDTVPRISFYMDVETGMLIRPVDKAFDNFISIGETLSSYNKEEKEKEAEIEKKKAREWIVSFNKEQTKKERPNNEDSIDKFNEFYENHYCGY